MKTERYVIGSGRPPEWCRNFLMSYRKMDGTTGWEFHAKWTTFILKVGDVLERHDGRILVKEKNKSEGTRIFATNRKNK